MFMNWKTTNQVQLPLHYDGFCSFASTQRGDVYYCTETSSTGAQLCVHIYKYTHFTAQVLATVWGFDLV